MESNGELASTTKSRILPVAIVPTEGAPAAQEVARTAFERVALAGLTVTMLALCVMLAIPFLPALAWGIAFSIVAWPLHLRIRRYVSSRSQSAFICTVLVVLVIVVPGLFVSFQLAHEASSGVERMKTDDVNATLRDRLAGTPGLEGTVAWIDRANIDLDAEVRKLVMSFTQNATSLLQGSLMALIQFAIALFILFNFLKDASSMRDRVRGLLPMSTNDCDRVFACAADSVHANIYATVVTSLINAITGGLLFVALGLPSPVLWSIVIFALSVLPVLGIFIVWVPASIYLMLSGNWPGGVALIAWGIGSAITVDSLLYVRLAGKRTRLHVVPSLLAFLGGLAVFGPSGMVLGPAILSVTVAVIEVWRKQETEAIADNDKQTVVPATPLIAKRPVAI